MWPVVLGGCVVSWIDDGFCADLWAERVRSVAILGGVTGDDVGAQGRSLGVGGVVRGMSRSIAVAAIHSMLFISISQSSMDGDG